MREIGEFIFGKNLPERIILLFEKGNFTPQEAKEIINKFKPCFAKNIAKKVKNDAKNKKRNIIYSSSVPDSLININFMLFPVLSLITNIISRANPGYKNDGWEINSEKDIFKVKFVKEI